MWPNPTDEVSISLEEVIESAKLEYSYQYLLWYWKEKGSEGTFNMPAELATEEEFDVVNNEIDISELDIMSRLPADQWLANVGGLLCECNYVKSNINQTQLLKDDDSLPDDYKPYLIIGKKIKFPKGTHSNKLTIIYANSGRDVDGVIEVSNELGALVRRGLSEVYLGKVSQEDKTNNSSANN
jgi:hypothetical protein